MKVELIYDLDCPNVEDAREQLRRALAEVGQPPGWQEWDRGDPSSPAYARAYGSPSVLVDGRDVAGALPSEDADCCRFYGDGKGRLAGVPPVEAIVRAIRNREPQPVALGDSKRSGGSPAWFAVLPAVGMALIPKIACPACWPAYAGLLSSLGLPFVANTTYLLPLTALFLVLAVGVLGFRAKRRWGYGPFGLGLAAAILVIVGKFVLGFEPALYGGIAILVGASFWNSWPRKTTAGGPCPACAQAEDAS